MMVAILDWDIDKPYILGDHVLDASELKDDDYEFVDTHDYFYKALQDVPVDEVVTLDDTAYWEPIDPDDNNDAYELWVAGPDTSIKEWFYYEVASDDASAEELIDALNSLVFQRTACNTWRVYLAPYFTAVDELTLTVFLYGTTSQTSYTIEETDLIDGYYSFTVASDGIWAIILSATNIGMSIVDYIFEYCGIETCYLSLIELIYCNDLDCCDGCSEELLIQRDFRRNELMKLKSFMDIITFTINYSRVGYTGILEGTDPREATIAKMQQYYTRIQEIVARCGSCNSNQDSSSGCSQCN